ncbi:hypothetical protein QVD17_08250 [Tagetes erecta]|uniref:Chalcone-flavonone isomerase family protein n=1 Tax=Tagetes erecta TaxID=13708 RepID=A0AAD8L2L8_TARER|nr:hypothetical protein QVD17_08250 [Tagetes erecta]
MLFTKFNFFLLFLITFPKDDVIPEAVNAELENAKLGQAILEMMIGKFGVSPEAKQSLASRISDILNEKADEKSEI